MSATCLDRTPGLHRHVIVRVLARRIAFCSVSVCALLASSSASAQLPPLEATRAGPHPHAVAHGEALVFARSFAAARSHDRLLVVYIENNGAVGALRSALFTVGGGATPALTRARDDLSLAPNARATSLTWDGSRGAVAYVIPRPPPAPVDPAHRSIRGPTVGVPASTDEPLGPPGSSGGEVAFLALDGEGAPVGAARVIFEERARLWRASVAREEGTWAVAWTGATVTDDEVRGTIRAMRLRDDGAPTRPMASASDFSGDPGDALRVGRVGGRTAVTFTGARCVSVAGAPAAPASLNPDPSARIDPPTRNPQPQAVPRRAPGPPVECGPGSLHVMELRADDTLGPVATGPWLRADAVSITDGSVVAPLMRGAGAVWARVSWDARGYGTASDLVTGAAFTQAPAPRYPPTSTETLTRPAPNVEVALHENPVEPPAGPSAGTLAALLAAPRTLSGASAQGVPLVAVTSDRRGLVLVREGALLATTPSFFYEAAVLPGDDPRASVVLAREGTWSGPLRFFALPASGSVTTLALPEARVAPPPPTFRPTRFPLRERLRYDAEYARLYVHARLLRGQFMRHENVAGMMAARPQAPTDPRMPGLLAVRNHLRNRWEGACMQLRARALVLARAGAGDDVVQGVNLLCDLHGELQLGVPVNPAL